MSLNNPTPGIDKKRNKILLVDVCLDSREGHLCSGKFISLKISSSVGTEYEREGHHLHGYSYYNQAHFSCNTTSSGILKLFFE